MPRARRLLAVGAIAVLLLLAGRLLAESLSAIWWAEGVSPAAGRVMRRWVWLGIGLDLLAIGVASAWFALHAVLVARAIGVVQVERQVAGARIREPIPRRTILIAAIVAGLLLGWITGSGARDWRAPVALWWSGVAWGATDPVLGVDLGRLVADLPVRELLHRYTLLLVILGGAFAAALYLAIGAFARRDGELEVHPDARRHLGALATAAALVIAAGYLLVPSQLAVGPEPPLSPMAGQVRGIAAQAMVGAAVAVAAMSLAWMLRARHSLLVSAWLVMLFGVTVERLIIPAFLGESAVVPAREQEARRLEALAWGIRLTGAAPSPDTLPPRTELWDGEALAAWGRARGGRVWSVAPVGATAQAPAGWLVATTGADDTLRTDVFHVESEVLGIGGRPRVWPSAAAEGGPPRATVAAARSLPLAPAWRVVPGAGVRAGAVPRRLLLAWGRQAPGMLTVPSDAMLDWHLPPLRRMEALLPMFSWGDAAIHLVDGRVTWIVPGLRVLSAFPLSTRLRWDRTEAAGVAPGVIALIDVETGAIRVYRDPADDPVGAAWAAWLTPLVEPADRLPGEARAALPYPASWFAAQAAVLSREGWVPGRPTARGTADGPPAEAVITRVDDAPAWQLAVEDPARRVISGLVTAQRVAGLPVVTLDTVERAAPENPRELERVWLRSPLVAQLRDSARAVGDSIVAGPIRWHHGAGALAAWMPVRTTGRQVGVAWIATARGTATAGGRSAAQAWGGVLAPSTAPGQPAGDLPARVEAARAWLRRADSALARGDLTAFGRAWEALRGLLDAEGSQ
ncbi:MAG TPA: UPF0182 family protein [Gemmatimonadales bacterium]|nr:UPF0182 family protein [Gemmatimonadales bacterium]